MTQLENGNGMHMSQAKYAQELLERAEMVGAKLVPIPMVSAPTLTRHMGNQLKDGMLYRKIIKGL